MFLFAKSNRVLKVVSIFIIQAFLLTSMPLKAIAEKQESVFKANYLAPQLQISDTSLIKTAYQGGKIVGVNTVDAIQSILNAINRGEDIDITSQLRIADLGSLFVVFGSINSKLTLDQDGETVLSKAEKVVLLQQYRLLSQAIGDRTKSLTLEPKGDYVENILEQVTPSLVNAMQQLAEIGAKLENADLGTLFTAFSQLTEDQEGVTSLNEKQRIILRQQYRLLNNAINVKSQAVSEQIKQILDKENIGFSSQKIFEIGQLWAEVYHKLIKHEDGIESLSHREIDYLRDKYRVLSKIISEKSKAKQGQGDAAEILETMAEDIGDELVLLDGIEVELAGAGKGNLLTAIAPIYNKLVMDMDAEQSTLAEDDKALLTQQYNLLSRVISKIEAGTIHGKSYISWQEFEEKELAGKSLNQQERNLASPQKIAFNIDTFAANTDVSLASGLNRIFDSMFRLLEANPNFAPTAIFLGDYADGMPSSIQRLAEFLNSNPFLGNANYRVGIRDGALIINGVKIPVYPGFARSEMLNELGVDFLVEATRQRYLENIDSNTPETKQEQKKIAEKEQAQRVQRYLDSVPGLNVVVLAPEEDKGDIFGQIPLSNRINTAEFTPSKRLAVMAEPVTAAASRMIEVLNNTVKEQNPRSNVKVAKVELMRTDRQGDRLLDSVKRKIAAALAKIFPKLALNTKFGTFTADTAVPKGANAIRCVFRINGRMPNFDFQSINNAFREASKKGLIAFADEPTVSSFETFNSNALVFRPITKQDIKTIRPSDAASYKTVVLTGYYSETGYAKQVLDFMTGVSLFKGNEASAEDKLVSSAPKETIPATAPRLKLQVLPDGKPLKLFINSVTGRISVALLHTLWDNPNFKIIGLNGFRAYAKDIVKEFLQNDTVYGKAPFTITTTADSKNLILTDRAERVTSVNNSNAQTLSADRENGIYYRTLIRTCYGNLIVEQADDNITMRLHGEDVTGITIQDNGNNTFTVQGELESGTEVRITVYQKEKALNQPFGGIISAGITRREIIPVTNIRAPRSAYVKDKGETAEEFEARRDQANREIASQFLAAMPQLNDDVFVLEASGALKDNVRFAPFLLAGAGRTLISAPAPTTDVTMVPGVSFDKILSVWDGVKSLSPASCTTNAAATGGLSIMDMFRVLGGYFNTIHAVTRSQGDLLSSLKKNIERSVDARRNTVYTTTGASKELGRAIELLEGIVAGISVRSGNDDGSLINYELQVESAGQEKMPSAEEINTAIKLVFETPYEQGGLAGFLGYGTPKTSLEIVGAEFGGIFDPEKTMVNEETGTLTLSIWYDNERGFLSQYVMLALFEALRKQEIDKDVKVIAQNVTPEPGAYTGMTSVKSAKEAGAKGALIGSGKFRTFAQEANQRTQNPVNVGKSINKTLTKALKAGFDLPILNVFFDAEKDDETKGVMSEQISAAFSGLHPVDIIKTIVSLEIANNNDTKFVYDNVQELRKIISTYVKEQFLKQEKVVKEEILDKKGSEGYAERINELQAFVNSAGGTVEKYKFSKIGLDAEDIFEKMIENGWITRINDTTGGLTRTWQKNKGAIREIFSDDSKKIFSILQDSQDKAVLEGYAALIGDRVKDKVRIVVKEVKRDRVIDLKKLALETGVDGIVCSFSTAEDYIGEINAGIKKSLDKQADLAERAVPRFLFVRDNHSAYIDTASVDKLKESAADNPQIEVALMPNPAQVRGASAMLKGEEVPNPYTPVDNVPVRVLLQNSVLGFTNSGFVNIKEALEYSGAHDLLFRHSEVKKLTGVSNKEIAQLVRFAYTLKSDNKLQGNVIVAVGETKQERDAGSYIEIVTDQALACFEGISKEEVANSIVAYEPRWAIGKTAAKPEDIQQMHQAIRAAIREKFGADAANKIRIIYGGNLNPENALEILALEDVDGGLIGGASRDPEKFSAIVKAAEQAAFQKKSTQTHWRKMYIAGNQKDYEIQDTYPEFVSALSNTDRSLVEVALGPKLADISLLTDVYTQDPLKGIITIDQLPDKEIKGKEVFVRVDFNMPVDDFQAKPLNPDTWKINSFARIDAALATINYIREKGGIVVLVTHSEPKGTNLKGPQSVEFLVNHLNQRLDADVKFVRNPLGSSRRDVLGKAKPGDVILFENLRLDEKIRKMEKSEDPAVRNRFAKQLYAGKNPIIVNEGFGIMHRVQASVVGDVPRVAGIGLARELRFCANAIRNTKGKKAFFMGGGPKMKDKIPLLRNIIQNSFSKGDKIFIYGGAALPFLKAKNPNFQAGSANIDSEDIKHREIIELAERKEIEIILPVDFVVAQSLPVDANHKVKTKVVDSIPAGQKYLDIGPKTIERFVTEARVNNHFGLIVCNGPAGVFEHEQFSTGTRTIFNVIAALTQTEANPNGAITILGGGDTIYAAELTGIVDKVSFASSGGGAFLRLLQGEDLPGVKALRGKAGRYDYLLDTSIPDVMERVIERVSKYAAQKALKQPFGPDHLTPMNAFSPQNQQLVSLIQSAI